MIIYYMDPFKYNFTKASSFQWLKGFHFSPKVNKAENGGNEQIWCFSMVYHTACPNLFIYFIYFFIFSISGIRFP